MSSPPDFLGMALSMINARRQAEAERDRTELAYRRMEEKRADDAFEQALKLVQSGSDVKAVKALYGDRMRYGDMQFLDAEGKKIQESLLNKANSPKGAEMEGIAAGLSALQQNNPDPLRGALDRIRAEKELPYPAPINERLGLRADLMSHAQKARAARERERGTPNPAPKATTGWAAPTTPA